MANSAFTPSGGAISASGSPSAGELAIFSAATQITNGNLSGDVTTNNTTATTVVAVHGVSYPASPSTNTVPVVTGSNTITYEAVPNVALANSAITIGAQTGLAGGGSVALGSAITLSMGTNAANTLAGYNSSGVFSDVAIGTNLTLSGGTLNATAGGGGVSSVSNADGSLTISPQTGAVIASINTANANTWTGLPTVNISNINNISTDGLVIENLTAAAAGSQQWSPRLHWIGQGWGTTPSASQNVGFIAEVQPVQGAASPSANLVLSSQISNAAYNQALILSNGGSGTFFGNLAARGGNIDLSSSGNGSVNVIGTANTMTFNTGGASSFLGASSVNNSVAIPNSYQFGISSSGNVTNAPATKLSTNSNGGWILSYTVRASVTAPAYLRVITPADTGMTASTEAIGIAFGGDSSNNSVTRQFATGALATQREYIFTAPTYGITGSSTITTAATLAVVGAPSAGSNATIVNPYAFWVQSGTTQLAGNTTMTGTVTGTTYNVNSNSTPLIQNTGNSVSIYGDSSAGLFARSNSDIIIGLDTTNVTTTSKFQVKSNTANFGGGLALFEVTENGIAAINNSGAFGISSVSTNPLNGSIDTFITRRGAANLRFGAADATSPASQIVSVQSVSGISNTSGVDWVRTASQGTGTGAGGNHIWQVAAAGVSSTAQNPLTTQMVLAPTGLLTLGNGAFISNGAIEQLIFSNGNSGTSKTLAWDNGNIQTVTISGAVTLGITAPTHPGRLTIIASQSAGTGFAYAFPATVLWSGGTIPTLSSASGGVDITSFIYDGSKTYGMANTGFK